MKRSLMTSAALATTLGMSAAWAQVTSPPPPTPTTPPAATPAPAPTDARPLLSLGGFFRTYVIYSLHDDDAGDEGAEDRPLQFFDDIEVHFNGAANLANGLRMRARVELEGSSVGDQIDEAWIEFAGNYGALRLGGDDAITTTWYYDVMAPGPAVHPNDAATFVPVVGGRPVLGGAVLGHTDPSGVIYTSPSFGGFQLGVSYQPDGDENATANAGLRNGSTADEGRFGLAAKYTASWMTAMVGYSQAWRQSPTRDLANTNSDGLWGLNGGVVLGMSEAFGWAQGWRLGGSAWYLERDVAYTTTIAGDPLAVSDYWRWGFDVGVAYAFDVWEVGLAYGFERENNVDRARDTRHSIGLGADYTLIPGVILTGGAIAGWADQNVPPASARAGDGDYLQFVVGTRVSF